MGYIMPSIIQLREEVVVHYREDRCNTARVDDGIGMLYLLIVQGQRRLYS